MAADLGTMVIELAANIANFQSDLGRVERLTRSTAKDMESAFFSAGAKIAATLSAAFAGIEFVQLVKGSIDAADKIGELTERIGGSVKGISELKFAAEQTGAGFDTLARGLLTISKNAAAAKAGNDLAGSAFRALGIEVADAGGALKSAETLLADVAEQFVKYRDGPEKSALALQLFGKAGVELIPVLNSGKQGLADFSAEAQRLGVSLDSGTTAAAGNFNDALDQIDAAIQGVGNQIASALLPALQDGAEGLRDLFVGAGDEIAQALLPVLQEAATEFRALIVAVKEGGVLQELAKGIAFVVQSLDDAAVAIGVFIGVKGIAGMIVAINAAITAAGGFTTAFAAARIAVLSFLASPVGIAAAFAAASVVIYKVMQDADALTERLRDNAKKAEESAARVARIQSVATSTGNRATFGTEKFFDDEVGLFTLADRARNQLGARLALPRQASRAAARDLVEDLKLAEAQFIRVGGTAEQFQAALTKGQGALRGVAEAARPVAPIIKTTADAARDATIADRAMAEAKAQAVEAVRNLTEVYKGLYAEEKRLLELELQAVNAGLQRSQRFNELLGDQERELQILQAIGPEREALVAQYRAEDLALSVLGKSRAELTEAERESLDQYAAALLVGEQQIEQLRLQGRALEETARFWDQVGSAAADAIGEFAAEALSDFDNIGDAFDDLADSLGNIAKRTIAQIISEFARLQVINPLINRVLGTNLQTGGGGSILGNLFGGGGTGASGGIGGLLGSIFGGSGAPGGGVGSSFVGPLQPGQVAPGGFGLGNALGVAGGLFGVYSAFQSGNPISGALSGAAAGSAILPGIGTIVGGIVGALAGVFGGSKDPQLRVGGVGQIRRPGDTFTTVFGQQQSGARGGAKGEPFYDAIRAFDEQIAAIVNSFSNAESQFAAVSAALSNFSVTLDGDEITAENLLGARFDAILKAFEADVQAFVGATGTLEERVQRLADAALIMGAVESGFVDSFAELASILSDSQIDGEALSATYQRVVGAFTLMDGVLNGLGLTTDLARNEFIRFSAGVVEALGGLDNAAALINRNLSAFLSPEEQRQIQISNTQSRLDAAGAAAGITGPITNEAFRELLNQAFAGAFDPARTAAILAYGAAFADLNELMSDAADTVGVVIEATAVDLSRLEDAAASVFDQLADFGRTDFERQEAAIRQQYAATAQNLRALAREAGNANETLGATGAAFQLMVLRLAEARDGLQRTVLRGLIDLYPTDEAPAREFGSELDLLQNGFRVAAEETQNWAAQLERLERLDAASTLARNLRSLLEDGPGGIAAGLAGLGVPLQRLLTDLGVNFADLFSTSSIDAFGRAARLLGLTADELASLSGVDLSGLDPTSRTSLNANAAKPDPVDTNAPVVGGLAKVADAANETTDEVERMRIMLSGQIDRLISAVVSGRSGGVSILEQAAVIG